MNTKIKTKLSEPEILKIMYDISLGVNEMHKLNLIHRDIKIENVLIDANHNFKLCDFGSTSSPIMPPKDQNQFQLLSHDILYQTTPQYRSPEMIDLYRGVPIDEKSDIWALGCFLYKLCYYTTPFEANGDIAILHASFHFPHLPQYSGDLKNLIIIMLQENALFRPNIYQVLRLVSKMLRINLKETGVKDRYNLGDYNFQALHEYQLHKQNELFKQQQFYLHQQNQSKNPSAVSLSQKDMNSRSHTPQPRQNYGDQLPYLTTTSFQQPNKSYNSLTVSRSAEEYSSSDVNTNIPSIVVPEKSGKYDQESLKSVKSTVSMMSIPKQNSSNYPETGSTSDLENLDNVEERYPSLDDLLEPVKPTKSNSSSGHVDKDATQYRMPKDGIKYSPYGEPYTSANVDMKPKVDTVLEFNRKEAWERLKSNLNDEAEKLVDDIFSSRNPEANVNIIQDTQPSNHTTSKSDLQNDDPISITNSDLDEYTENIDNKFPDITQEAILKNVPIQEDVTKSNIPRVQLKVVEKLDLPLSTEPSVQQVALKSPEFVPCKDPASSQRGQEIAPPIPEVKQEHKDINQSKHNPFPFPGPSNTTGTGNSNSVVCDKKQSQSNPWGQYRSQPPNIPASSYQPTYQPNESPTLPIQEQLGSLNILNFPDPIAVSETTPEVVNTYLAVESSPNLDEFQFDNTNSNQKDLKVNNSYLPSDLNDLVTKQRTRSRDEFSNRRTKEPILSRIQNIDTHLNLIDLDIGDESDVSNATPVLKKTVIDEEPSLLDLYTPEEKKDVVPHYKKRISSIQDQKWEEEVIDFESDDEDPEKNSRMNRLSIRSSLKKPKRKSGEYRRSEGSNNEEILY
jgi:protein-serine/threonine kinase